MRNIYIRDGLCHLMISFKTELKFMSPSFNKRYHTAAVISRNTYLMCVYVERTSSAPDSFISSEMEWQAASLLTKSSCPLVSHRPPPGLIRLVGPFCDWPLLCPINPWSHSHEPRPQLLPHCLRDVCVYVALDLEGVCASINTEPAEGDTCK